MNPQTLDNMTRDELAGLYQLAQLYSAWVQTAALLRRCGIPNGRAIHAAGLFRRHIAKVTR